MKPKTATYKTKQEIRDNPGKCHVQGCKAYISKKLSDIYCNGHLMSYEPELMEKRRAEKKLLKTTGNSRYKRKTPKPILARSNFSVNKVEASLLSQRNFGLEREIGLLDGGIEKNNMQDTDIVKQKLFARWLNAEQSTRSPQSTQDVARVLKVSFGLLSRWESSLLIQKMRVELLDNVMRYDLRHIAYSGLARLLADGDQKAIDRYFSTFVEKKKEAIEKDDNLSGWIKKLAKELPEDAKANSQDTVVREVSEGLVQKGVMDE